MFRFLFKWSLQITGVSLIGYNYLTPQKRANLDGACRSIINTSRASYALLQSIYEYHEGLKGIEQNTDLYHQKRSQIHSRVANRILDLGHANKGVYLKLGQYLGNLDQVMPWEFTQVLKNLQDSGPSIPYEQIKVVIQEDLGLKPRDIFQKFNKSAFAAASLAQVHRATLKKNNKQVAVKIQFPFMKSQSKWDLWALRGITDICNYILRKYDHKDIDLPKIFNSWAESLMEELDFERQIANAEVTRKLFKENPHVHVPRNYPEFSSDRVIVMEYIDGIKITETDKLKEAGFQTKVIASKLVNIFSEMLFKHGFVHCDAHPGNILIRRRPFGADPKEDYQIVLLDHGLYRHLTPEFMNDFSNLWISLVKSDRKGVEKYSANLNISSQIQNLPIILLSRTIKSHKKIGESITEEQKQQLKQKDMTSFHQVNSILHDLPPDLVFIIKATNLIASHNLKLGGNQRDRILKFTKSCLRNVSQKSSLNYTGSLLGLSSRIWIFEHLHGIHKSLFGTLA